MYNLVYMMSKYLLILNVAVLLLMALVGPTEILWIFIGNVALFSMCMTVFKKAIKVNEDRVKLMNNEGSNDYPKEEVTE